MFQIKNKVIKTKYKENAYLKKDVFNVLKHYEENRYCLLVATNTNTIMIVVKKISSLRAARSVAKQSRKVCTKPVTRQGKTQRDCHARKLTRNDGFFLRDCYARKLTRNDGFFLRDCPSTYLIVFVIQLFFFLSSSIASFPKQQLIYAKVSLCVR